MKFVLDDVSKQSNEKASTTDCDADELAESEGELSVQPTFPETTTKMIFVKSVFQGRPSTAFFPYYPPSSNFTNTSERLYELSGKEVENLFMSFASQ